MPEPRWTCAAEAFLAGDPQTVGAVRAVVEAVVAGFSFATDEGRRDVIQEALGRLVDSIRSGRYRADASLTTFAHSVARYTCIEHARRHRIDTGDRVEAVESTAADPEAALLRAEEHGRNLSALSKLSPQARELLHLIFIERLSYRDVGTRLGLSEAAVKSRVHRCRLMLRELAHQGEPSSRGDTSAGMPSEE